MFRRMSDTAARAELRDTHVEIIEIRKDFAEIKSKLGIMRQEDQRLAETIRSGTSRIDRTNSAIKFIFLPLNP